jgi:hypothetical protein
LVDFNFGDLMPLHSTKPVLLKPIVKLHPVFADQYQGEWINYNLGDNVDRVFYKPKKDFYRANGRAIVFGNGLSRTRWPLAKFNQSNKNKLLTHYNILYGCNRAFQEKGEFDFLTVSSKLMATEIPKDLHQICYANQETQRVNPQMNLLPLYQRFDTGSSAVLLACFHGADRVFLFGFDGDESNFYSDTKFYPASGTEIDTSSWSENLYQIMISYPNVKFYQVGNTPPHSRRMTVLPNYESLTFSEFVSYADL